MASALYVMYEQHQDQNFVSRNFSFDMRKQSKYSSDFAPDYALEITGDSEGPRGQKNRPFGRSNSFVTPGASARIEREKLGSYGGYGGSNRIDLEPAASEDSCTPKRKSISLNVNRNEGFNVPIQVYAISVMSTTERRELGKRLKIELDQVRSMHRKIESKVINSVAVSSSSDLPSLSYGQRNSRSENGRVNGGPLSHPPGIQIPAPGSIQIPAPGSLSSKDKRTAKANQLYLSADFFPGKDKAAAAHSEKSKSKGGVVGSKRSLSGRFDSSRDEKRHKEDQPTQQLKADPMIMKQCGTILRRLMLHKFGWVFNSPVDIVKLKIPDYFKVIKNPMDLGTIKERLERQFYSDPRDFAADVRLTFSNAMAYNPPGNDVHVMADQLNKIFEDKWRSVERKHSEILEPSINATKGALAIPAKQHPQHQQIHKKVTEPQHQQIHNKVAEPRHQQGHSKFAEKHKQNKQPKLSSITTEPKPKHEPFKRSISTEEKAQLSRDLESLTDMPEEIIDFFRKHSSDLSQDNEDEIEVDIDAFDNDTLVELRKIVTSCINERKRNNIAKNQLKVDPCEAEPANGLRQGNISPVCNRKGGDPADEDVDIGENDLPAPNYPPVEIEKDTAGRSSKCSSSSSSSSDSGSSSSDSDSASSSGSESDAVKAPSPDAAPKEPMGTGAVCDQRTSLSAETHGAKRSVSELEEENNSKLAPATEADRHEEGESAPSERQVSPDKLYRAALLRSRFADTILKAQEKTLSQGDRGDPEKLRREREELERRQREEKARLQSEAKAAELARMQAEAEAAAEAKRKLEIEREAARQALQQMEKTVEIYENTQAMNDLEMLRQASQPDHIPSSGDETSPGHSQNGLSSFPLQGRNPLEQLGLFMKRDDEEEEEPIAISAPGNGDVEEGEID
uniref:Bromo domain-containing protein n=1 Tax=Araucaria cunninghamii TaxID=56994 RepID=A0A0D6QUC0_ARACU